MLEASLSQPAFYFSFSYDITHTLHRMHVGGESFYSQGLLARADTQFVWNNHFLEPLLRFPEMAGFLVPIMHGFVGFASTTALGTTRKAMELALLSRRSTFRAGTRFNRSVCQSRSVSTLLCFTLPTLPTINYRYVVVHACSWCVHPEYHLPGHTLLRTPRWGSRVC